MGRDKLGSNNLFLSWQQITEFSHWFFISRVITKLDFMLSAMWPSNIQGSTQYPKPFYIPTHPKQQIHSIIPHLTLQKDICSSHLSFGLTKYAFFNPLITDKSQMGEFFFLFRFSPNFIWVLNQSFVFKEELLNSIPLSFFPTHQKAGGELRVGSALH